MSRCLRQSSQLARLARASPRIALQRGLVQSTTAHAGVPRVCTTPYGVRPRYYSSKPPSNNHDENKKKPASKDGEKADQTEKSTGENNPEKPEDSTKLPLPQGWVYLSQKDFESLKNYRSLLPKANHEMFDNILSMAHRTGVPADLQLLVEKLGKGQSLTLMEKGQFIRCLFSTVSQTSRQQVKDMEAGKGKDSFNGGWFNSSENDTSGGSDGNQKDSKSPPNGSPASPNGLGRETISTILGVGIVWYLSDYLTKPMTEQEVTWQEVRKSLLEKGLVSKLVVIDRSRVRVELTSDAEARMPGDTGVGRRKTLFFSIGEVKSFEKKLDEAQDQLQIPPNQRIPVSYESSGSGLGSFFLAFGPTLLFIGLILYTQRSMGSRMGGGGGVFNIGKSKAKKFNADSAVRVKFTDVAGMEEAKTEIMEFVSFLKNPKKFEKLGAKIPRGAILAGPPGTGKTLLAKATAGESGVPFFSVSGSEFVEMFVGVGSSRVRDLFAEGRKNAPCIIFIDEIDAIGRSRQDGGRGFGGNDEREATLNQILTEMDGFNSREQVVVLAGTNRPDVLDKALMRPGRFDRHIYIDRPTAKGREEIFHVYMKKIVTKEDVDHLVGRLATLTPGFSGADIANVVNEAALIAARYNADDVKMTHFEQAIERVVAGLERKSLVLKPEEKKTVAYHEAGHAICGWYLKDADPLLKVSIIPRGQGALGYAQYLPQDAYLMNTEQLMDRMAMTMGGRVSEELHFPTVTTGASDDFKKVSQMARSMVTQWGMSEKVGPMHYDQDPNQVQKPFAESTAQQIDQEVHRIVEAAYQRCRDLLTAKKKEVGLIAEELLRKEMLVRDDMVRILGKRPFGDNADFEKYFGGGKEKSAPPPPPSEGPPSDAPAPSPAFKRADQ